MKYLDEYKADIESGKAIVNKWILANFSMVEKGLANKDFFYDSKKADLAINFIELFCHHVEGKTENLKLEIWQKYFYACMFGLVDENGLRHFREYVLTMGRKQGKSLMASSTEVKVAYTENEPGMQIYNIAPKLEQAKIIYETAYKMIELVPSLSKRKMRRRSDIYIPSKNATLKPIAFSSKKSDGFNPHVAVFDEFGAWEGEQGLKMYNVMLSAEGARREPINLAVSTANYIDDGLYDELILRSTSVLMGKSKESRLFPLLYMIEDANKWNDLDELRKALPNLGVSVSESFIMEEARKAEASPSYKAEFLTKYCNIKQNSLSSWLSASMIEKTKCERLELSQFRRHYAFGGIDLSQTTDLTAASLLIKHDGIDYIFCHFFMPKDKVKELTDRDKVQYQKFIDLGFLSTSGEHYVQYQDVLAWYESIKKQYKIIPIVVGYDRYSAQYLVSEMDKKGYKMDDVIQGTNLTPVIDEFGGLIADGKVRTGTNGLLQSHFANVALKHTAEDKRVRPMKIEQRKHIDGFVAVIDAYTVRQKWYEKYKWQIENKGR